MPLPFLLPIVGIGVKLLADKMQGSAAGPRCEVSGCQQLGDNITQCCRCRLCDQHLRMWKADPNPCPCHRR